MFRIWDNGKQIDFIPTHRRQCSAAINLYRKRGVYMPTTYAHYKFGKEVISALPRPLQSAIENNRELFDIGVHGTFFFIITR